MPTRTRLVRNLFLFCIIVSALLSTAPVFAQFFFGPIDLRIRQGNLVLQDIDLQEGQEAIIEVEMTAGRSVDFNDTLTVTGIVRAIPVGRVAGSDDFSFPSQEFSITLRRPETEGELEPVSQRFTFSALSDAIAMEADERVLLQLELNSVTFDDAFSASPLLAPILVPVPLSAVNIANDTVSINITDATAVEAPAQLIANIPSNVVTEGDLIRASVDRPASNSSGAVQITVATVDGTATEGSDFAAITTARSSAILTWASGESGPKPFQLQISNDEEQEEDEQFGLTFALISGNALVPADVTITIEDNDSAPPLAGVVGFASVLFETPEIDGPTTVSAERTGDLSGPVSVDFSTRDGTATEGDDYNGASGTLNWADGEGGNKSFTVTIIDDVSIETDESIFLRLENLSGNALLGIDTATLSILEGDIRGDSALVPQARTVYEAEIAVTIENVCISGRAREAETAEGDDLQDRCDEMIRAATVANQNGVFDPQISDALAAVAPEEYAAQGTASIETMAIQGLNIRDRLLVVRAEGGRNFSVAGLNFRYGGNSLSGKAFSGGAASADDAGFQRWGFFVNGNINFGDKDANQHEGGFDFDSRGITFGADYRFDDGVVLGAAIGYTNTDNDFASSGGNSEIDAYSFNLYGTWYKTDNFYIDGTAAWGTSDYDNKRRIRYTLGNTSVDQVADSSTSGDEFSMSLGAGYNLQLNALTVTPNVLFEYIVSSIDNYQESLSNANGTGQGLGLEIDEQNEITSYSLSMGGQVSYAISQNWGVLLPYGSFDWIHEFDNDPRRITGSFLNDSGRQAFVLSTDSPDRNYFNLGLGLTAQFAQGRSAFLSFDTTLGLEDVSSYSINGGIRFEF